MDQFGKIPIMYDFFNQNANIAFYYFFSIKKFP
jgi:hypothetical protein